MCVTPATFMFSLAAFVMHGRKAQPRCWRHPTPDAMLTPSIQYNLMLWCDQTGVAEQATAAALATDARPQDNRGFTDTNTAQKLTEEDIVKMKTDGRGGQAIIQVCRFACYIRTSKACIFLSGCGGSSLVSCVVQYNS